jgi:hypothetical protein
MWEGSVLTWGFLICTVAFLKLCVSVRSKNVHVKLSKEKGCVFVNFSLPQCTLESPTLLPIALTIHIAITKELVKKRVRN